MEQEDKYGSTSNTYVKLVYAETGLPLRYSANSDNGYFQMTVPQPNTVIEYYPFNEGEDFKGEPIAYKVEEVRQELQESWNSSFNERWIVKLRKVEN